MDNEKNKAWITKYALTDGIGEVDGYLCEEDTILVYANSHYRGKE